MEEEEAELIIGRIMSSLLNAKPNKLAKAIINISTSTATTPLTVELRFLHKYIGQAVVKGQSLDQLLVPIIQHSLKMRESKQGDPSIILLNWLFQDQILFQPILENLAGIVSRRNDRYITLGWCIMGRSLIECENPNIKLETNGSMEKYDAVLKIFYSSVTHLISIICNGSNMQEGFELPTRLAIAAADFFLSLTVALTTNNLASKNIIKKQKSLSTDARNQSNTWILASASDKQANTLRETSELPSSMEPKLLLWNNLDDLIILVKKITAELLRLTRYMMNLGSSDVDSSCFNMLVCLFIVDSLDLMFLGDPGQWSKKSRSLHAKGSERILKWLQEMKQQYGCFQHEADTQMFRTGSLLLSSCWKHYGMLLHLEDSRFPKQYKELLDQYLSGIQFYADDKADEPSMNNKSRVETINFFVNCLLLLLGRLNYQQFENAVTEFGSRISQVLMSQCADEEVIDGSISIFKAVILKTNHTLSKSSLGDVAQMDAVLPILLNLLDERDTTAKAVVKLVAEYCSLCSDSKCLHDVLKGIDSKSVARRRNAFDVVATLIHISSESASRHSPAMWQEVADHLLKCLEDEDEIIQNQAANLIPKIDPPLVLPALVGLSYSAHKRVQLSASSALLALLMNHKHKPEILCMLLDSLSNLCQNSDSCAPTGGKGGPTLDNDSLLKLLSEWAKNVEDWNVMVDPLMDKMFAEPSNAVIVRFLSHVSEYLAEAADLVFHRLILYIREQKENEECRTERKREQNEHCLFSRLCPLLVIRLLPLRVFDNINSPLVYGEILRKSADEEGHHIIEGTKSISAFLIKRALSKSEYEEVRKLAAELCGRIHPEVLLPIVSSLLERAADVKDVLKIKVSLFSFCTSLMVRGSDTYRHPDVSMIRKTMHNILSWSSLDGEELVKAQHGCIDCLALMLCIELQAPESSKSSVGRSDQSGGASFRSSVLAYVINQLTDDEKVIPFESDGGDRLPEVSERLSFRLCMANVLISACQKISGSGKKSFAEKALPRVMRLVELTVFPEIRAACIQVLFSMVYHLKPWILPYANDILSFALRSLKEGPHKEKMGGAKLLASLMASEEEVIETISSGLLGARALLENLSLTDDSSEVRQMCRQLLVCFTSQ